MAGNAKVHMVHTSRFGSPRPNTIPHLQEHCFMVYLTILCQHVQVHTVRLNTCNDTANLTHRDDSILKSHQSLSHSRIFQHFRNPKVHNSVHKTPPEVPILSKMNPDISPHPISLRVILSLSSHLILCLPIGLFAYGFPTKILYAFYMP
jgi:hypothetical protein